MDNIDHRFIKKWEKAREKGEFRYILRTGVVGWGLTSAIVVLLVLAFFETTGNPHISFTEYINSQYFLQKGIFFFFIFIIVGMINGKLLWMMNEKAWKKEKEKLQK